MKTISINRAPDLTLWAAVVAQRLGFDEDEAFTLGKALAGLNAQAKGRRLGIFKPCGDRAVGEEANMRPRCRDVNDFDKKSTGTCRGKTNRQITTRTNGTGRKSNNIT